MIESKRINIIVTIAVCFALVFTILLIGFGDSDTAKTARQAKYITELFGDEIITVEIKADEDEWQSMIANASSKEYIMADVVVNGVTYQSVGVRAKGNASLSQVSQSSSPERYSLHITFDEYIKNQTCFGLDVLILNNLISDSTYMKEYMSQDIMRYIGAQAPLTNYASISVNGEGIGFYIALEYYGDSYTMRVYEDTTGNFYNVKTMQMGGAGGGPGAGGFGMRDRNDQDNQDNAPDVEDWNDRADFVERGGGSAGGSLMYTDDEISSYSAIFDNAHGTVSTSDQEKVIEALKNLSTATDLEKYFDVDEILRYFAAHTVVVNLDSYYSNMAQNYFIYERNGQISILPWDYHLSYGAFQSGSASSVVNYPIDTPVSGVTMESRPLLNVLLSNEEYLAKYHAYLQDIVDNYFGSGLFEETVRGLQARIADYVVNDPTAFYTFEEFETGVDTLIELNMLRAESIAGQLDGSIPSTTDGQSADPDSLIDASTINMSDLGSNGGGVGGFGGPPGGMADGQNGPGGVDMDAMRQAMQIIQEAGGEITDEIKDQLLELGLTEEQIEMFSNMGGGMGPPDGMQPPGDMQGFPGGNQDGGGPPDFNWDGDNQDMGIPPDGNMPAEIQGGIDITDGNSLVNAQNESAASAGVSPSVNPDGGAPAESQDEAPIERTDNSSSSTAPTSGAIDWAYYLPDGILVLLLIVAIIVTAKLRRNY